MQQIDLRPFLQQVEQQQINMEGILLWQRGQEVARHFFRPEYRRNQFSVSKSFTSAAVGAVLPGGPRPQIFRGRRPRQPGCQPAGADHRASADHGARAGYGLADGRRPPRTGRADR